jgi:dihydropteroate synthase
VTLDEELRRVLPVVEALAGSVGVPISVDTMKAGVARRALAAGATLINDVSALRFDDGLVDVVAETGCPVCLMHMQGLTKTMQEDPRYDDVVAEVLGFLEERMAFALARGVREEQIMVDPGIGFGKTVAHNLALLDGLDRFSALGRPVLLGASRKRFLGAILGAEPSGRAVGTVATTVIGYLAGAHVFRVHDVKPNFEALRVALAVREGVVAP